MNDQTNSKAGEPVMPPAQDTPLPRGAGADVPQSDIQPGHGSLDYTEQNFNALVAANSAMEAELNTIRDVIASATRELEQGKEAMRAAGANADAWRRQCEAQGSAAREYREAVENERVELQYFRDHAQVLERKLERMKGYVDRVIEQDLSCGEPRSVEAPPRPVGPALDDIVPAVRRSGKLSADGNWAELSMVPGLLRSASDEPVRRY